MTLNRTSRPSLLLSPPLILAGWALMRLLGSEGREPGWTIAHLVWLAGYVLLGIACAALYRLATDGSPSRRPLALTLLAIALVGDLCMNVQMSIDLIAGFATGTVAAKNAFTDSVQAVPGVEPMVYQLGPALLFTALLAQTIQAAVVRRLPPGVPVLVGAAVAVMIVDRTVDTPFRLTMGVASVLLWIAFAIVAGKRATAGLSR